jgi:hypothetical protein
MELYIKDDLSDISYQSELIPHLWTYSKNNNKMNITKVRG